MAKMGRPPLYTNCMDFDAMCELYFESCDLYAEPIYSKTKVKENNQGEAIPIITGYQVKPKPYTMEKLAEFLGFYDRDSVLNYEKRKIDHIDFAGPIKRARLRICGQVFENGLANKGSAIFAIFYGRNNSNYTNEVSIVDDTDRPETDLGAKDIDRLKRLSNMLSDDTR